MAAKVAIIVNKEAGADPLAAGLEDLKEVAKKHELDATFITVQGGEEAAEKAREAADGGASMVVAAGGDGTLSAVASGLLGTSAKLGVVPMGTFNHFAADLGIPADTEEAVRVLKEGVAEAVDVGEVNRQIFLNNSSIGLYPRLVHEREEQKKKSGAGKLAGLVRAFTKVLRKYPSLTLRVKLPGKDLIKKTSFIFVGNNEYILEGLRMGRRQGLKQGYLDIGVAERTNRKDLLSLFLRSFFGKLGTEPYFDEYKVHEAQIDSRRRFLPVALDGEVKIMRTPLRFKIRPKALTVMLPRLA